MYRHTTFIVLRFIALHEYCTFYKLKLFHQQKDYSLLYRGGLEPNLKYL